MEFVDPQIMKFAGPCFIALVLLEVLLSLKYEPEVYNRKDLAASGAMGVGAAIIAMGSKALQLAFYFLIYNLFNTEVDGVMTNVFGWQAFGFAWFVWLLCQLADDFSYYWFHRANHEIRFFWAAHVVHHSSEHFNLGTGLRNGWFTLVYKPLFYMWMPAIGFHPVMCIVCLAIESLWQFQLHTQFLPRSKFFGSFMNMHDHHSVHHSSRLEYLDKNHGGYLNIFDRLFGTFKEHDDELENHFGVLSPPNSHHPWTILTHEYAAMWKDFKKARSFKEGFMYVFGPPGWCPDGSKKTVKQLQAEMAKNKAA